MTDARFPEFSGPGAAAMAELASSIGEAAARSLARGLGGTTVCVPHVVGENHPLRVVLGEDDAAKMAERFRGERVYIPKPLTRHASVRELRRARSYKIRDVALETGYSERHVYRLLAEKDDRQLDLFEE